MREVKQQTFPVTFYREKKTIFITVEHIRQDKMLIEPALIRSILMQFIY